MENSFPGQIEFYGDGSFGAARVGSVNPALPGTVVDVDLVSYLGKTDVTINVDLGNWVVLDPLPSQPSTLWPMLLADVELQGSTGTETQSATPLTVRFDFGTGQVLFTSVHQEAQATQDLTDILYFIIGSLQ